jgi:hypothetical protein
MIFYCTTYVINIFIICNKNETTAELLLQNFNKRHQDLQFSISEENNNQIEYLNFILAKKYEPITVAARSKAWNVFPRSNTGIVGSNPTQVMDVSLRLL